MQTTIVGEAEEDVSIFQGQGVQKYKVSQGGCFLTPFSLETYAMV